LKGNKNTIRIIGVVFIWIIFTVIFAVNNPSLSNDTLSYSKVEKAFYQKGIKLELLTDKGNPVLQGENGHTYFFSKHKDIKVTIYAFKSIDEREKGFTEFNEYSRTALYPPCEIYEAKNLLIFLYAGNKPNEHYELVDSIVDKINK
jgi:hypothetical protein